MSDTTELIKEKLDAADFIKTYVPLQLAGKNWKGLCPFHKEKTPSFIVSPDRQSWHCFGCNTGGDVIAFLMRYENIEFLEALKILGERAGVDVRAGGGDARRYAALYDISEAAKEFFRQNLFSQTAYAESARRYLGTERGLKQETIEEFELGLAPSASDAITRHLLKTGYKVDDIERAGLAFKTERGTYWDRFRNRIVFPLKNHFGKTVGFTGRILDAASPEVINGRGEAKTIPAAAPVAKYVNSPETPIFSKSKLLFGFHASKNAIRGAKTAVVVEGQMDFLAVWQDGIKNVIASSGTALTAEHLKSLKRLAETLVLALDTDEAGHMATERVIDLANASDFSVKILLPATKAAGERQGVKDPADIARHAPGLMQKLIADSEPAMRYYLRRYIGERAVTGADADAGLGALKRNIRTVLAKINVIASPVERGYWVRELSEQTRIPEQQLSDEMAAFTGKSQSVRSMSSERSGAADLETPIRSRRDLISERVLSLSLADADCREKLSDYISFLPHQYQRVAAFFGERRSDAHPKQGATATASSPELARLADLVGMRASLETAEPAVMRAEFADLIKHLKIEHYRAEQAALGAEIRRAEGSGDAEGLARALREFDRISKEIYNN